MMKTRYSLLVLAGIAPLVVSFDFASLHKQSRPRTRPDYSNERFWIALPDRHDAGDTIPMGCDIPEDQAHAQVDVFYVHPTVYLVGNAWNADLDDKKVNANCDACVCNQASAFNNCAKIYAPRYRQGHLKCFTRGGQQGQDALDTAYADVKKAFQYYLDHYNNGRPIILAGHSQGALHVSRLLEDFFDGKPLMQQLVAAYPIGFIVSKSKYKQIPPADSATQTGCFITWNTVAWGQDTVGAYKAYRGNPCVNPLTWMQTSSPADYALHKGGLPFDWQKGIQKNCVRTQVHGTLLWVDFPSGDIRHLFYHLASSYHVSDVNLFYMNIRENAVQRVKAYTSKNTN